MSDSTELANARQEAKNTAWMYESKAGKNIVDYMIKTIEG